MPWFGNDITSPDATDAQVAGFLEGVWYITPPIDLVVDYIDVYISLNAGCKGKMAVYENGMDEWGEKPGYLVQNSVADEITTQPMRWNRFTYSGNRPVLRANTKYWFMGLWEGGIHTSWRSIRENPAKSWSMGYSDYAGGFPAQAPVERYPYNSLMFCTKIYYTEIPKACEKYTDQESCESYSCYWYNNSCHSDPQDVPQPPNWQLIALASIGCIAVVGGIVYFMRRRN